MCKNTLGVTFNFTLGQTLGLEGLCFEGLRKDGKVFLYSAKYSLQPSTHQDIPSEHL